MKKILFVLFFIMPFASSANPELRNDSLFNIIPLVDGSPCYTEVVNVDDTKADVLYSRAKTFIAKKFKSFKDVIQLDDAPSFHIIGKATYNYQGLGTLLHYTLDIQARDGRYKYIITDMHITINTVTMGVRVDVDDPFMKIFNDKGDKSKKPNKNLKSINAHFDGLIEELKIGMESSTDDNW